MSEKSSDDEKLGRRIAAGAGWTLLFRGAARSLGLISTLILARLLVPEDFGLVALAMTFYAILDVLGSFGFDVALIQNQKADRHLYDTAWTLNLVYSVVAGAVLFALAHPLAVWFDDTRLESIIWCLGGLKLLMGVENIGVTDFRKHLRMGRDFVYMICPKVGSFITTVTLIFFWRTYWVLVIGIVVGNMLQLVAGYVLSPFRPRLSLKGSYSLYRFSRWMFLSNVANFLNGRADDLIVGKFAGAGPLGLYTIAYEISNLATTELLHPLNRALYPGYSMIAGDTVRLRRYFLNVQGIMALLAFPVCVGIAVVSPELVITLLGRQWLPAVPLLQVLSFFGLAYALGGSCGIVSVALGRPKILTYFVMSRAAAAVPLLLFAVHTYGAVGAAWTQASVSWVLTPVMITVAMRQVHSRPAEIVGVLWRPAVAAGLMAAAVHWVAGMIPGWVAPLRLVVEIWSGAVAYSVAIILLWAWAGRPEGSESIAVELIVHRRWPGSANSRAAGME
jgi:O-antigen/teichoic acid export membrane protein